ncbi:MAG: nitronate monooxygenase [Kiritimatiellales bacterium]
MGASISNWRLAQAVSRIGQLGVISGTALDGIISRRLQDGDPDGLIHHALEHFPFPSMAQRVLDAFFIPGGKPADAPYRKYPMHTLTGPREPLELCIVGNFVEVFLARQGHSNPVGINYLEKLQLPHLPSIYGALLAGVAVVIMGAGIPLAIPEVLTALIRHERAEYPIYVAGANGKGETVNMVFDPALFIENSPLPNVLTRPDFLPIVSSEALAKIMLNRTNGPIAGFIIENSSAGGHNAPPRGKATFNILGEPVYGLRDISDLSAFRELGLPFWLAGSFGSAEALQQALAEGASGVQVGTAFALCEESGLRPDVRHELIALAQAGKAHVFTDSLASPTGFPFKVADLPGSLSDETVYRKRQRICDLGLLRQPYRKADGTIGYRCPAEPVASYVAKGGLEADTVGRKCLCNALIANAGMPQRLSDGTDEQCLITMGNDLAEVCRFCKPGRLDFSATDVVRILLKA